MSALVDFLRQRYAEVPESADVQAKRRLVELHAPWIFDDGEPPQTCRECDSAGYPCPTLLILASPFSAHGDYRPEWRVPGLEGPVAAGGTPDSRRRPPRRLRRVVRPR